MPVFISHRTLDDAIARSVYDRLMRVHGIKCYLDDLDLQQKTENVTALIVSRVRECTHLLALVTSNTRGSWWVPFEVGVAREAPRIISTFTAFDQLQLPDYLTEWPVLRGQRAVDIYADYYKKGRYRVSRLFLEGVADPSGVDAVISAIHRDLKAALTQ